MARLAFSKHQSPGGGIANVDGCSNGRPLWSGSGVHGLSHVMVVRLSGGLWLLSVRACGWGGRGNCTRPSLRCRLASLRRRLGSPRSYFRPSRFVLLRCCCWCRCRWRTPMRGEKKTSCYQACADADDVPFAQFCADCRPHSITPRKSRSWLGLNCLHGQAQNTREDANFRRVKH